MQTDVQCLLLQGWGCIWEGWTEMRVKLAEIIKMSRILTVVFGLKNNICIYTVSVNNLYWCTT